VDAVDPIGVICGYLTTCLLSLTKQAKTLIGVSVRLDEGQLDSSKNDRVSLLRFLERRCATLLLMKG
jgi:hypothetical protein